MGMDCITGATNYLNLCVFEGVEVLSPNGTTTPKFSMRIPPPPGNETIFFTRLTRSFFFSLVRFKFVCVSFLFTLFHQVDGTIIIVRKKTVRVGNTMGWGLF